MERKRDKTRSARQYQRLRPGADLDLIVYTPQEFEQMRGRGFVRQALEEGRILRVLGHLVGGIHRIGPAPGFAQPR